jgi:hypothetical protein
MAIQMTGKSDHEEEREPMHAIGDVVQLVTFDFVLNITSEDDRHRLSKHNK